MKIRFYAMAMGLLMMTASASAATLIEEEITVNARIRGWTYALNALTVRRADAANPLPLALMTHGSPYDAADRPKMRPQIMRLVAHDFAHRGWLVVVFSRRGFGVSEGPYAEGYVCENPNFTRTLATAAQDIEAVRLVVSQWPNVDASRVLGIGQSLGGGAMLSWAAEHPPGLVGIVNVSGGAGAIPPTQVNCDGRALVSTFASLGADVQTPTLWLYAENDLYLAPDLVRRMHRAFTEAGASATFTMFGPLGKDGHDLFFTFDGKHLWLPALDRFLRSQNLPTWDVAPMTAVSQNWGSEARRTFNFFLGAPTEKAISLAQSGKLARYWSGADNLDIVGQRSREECEKAAGEPCRVVVENFTPVDGPGNQR